jgi:2-methylcitrate dehydratase PrpD
MENDLGNGIVEARLAAALVGLRGRLRPAEVETALRTAAFDTFGVLAGAHGAPGISALNDSLAALSGGAGRSQILLTGIRVDPGSAAMANGAAIHALDFDDQYDPARVHVFSVVLPAALATAETLGGVSLDRFFDALAIGAELFCRLGLACRDCLDTGWHPTTLLGAFAAAATSGTLLGLDERQMVSALGLAYSQISGTVQVIEDGVLAKRLGPGFAARSGLVAAHLAAATITGAQRFLSGKAGLFAQYRIEGDPALLTERLGEDWHLARLSLKPFPCCRCSHSLAAIAIDLHSEGLRPDDVVSGALGLSRTNHAVVGRPFAPESAENPGVHGQFCAAYAFARALSRGNLGPMDFTAAAVLSGSVALARGLKCTVETDFEPRALAPARVRLLMRSGETLTRLVERMPGAPDLPLSLAQLRAKFSACLGSVTDSHVEAFRLCLTEPEAGTGTAETVLSFRRLVTGYR